MALPPTGSDKLLEICTDDIYVVIKADKQRLCRDQGAVSSIVVEGRRLRRVVIKPDSTDEVFDGAPFCRKEYAIVPLFFEQTYYEIVIAAENGEKVSFYNENRSIRKRVKPVRENDYTTLSGIIRFENTVGYSDLVIFSNDKKVLTIRIEVFPTKISYKEDYARMTEDISEMVCEAVLDFLQKTYRTFSVGHTRSSLLSVFFQIIRVIFEKYMNAVGRIIETPHHKLVTEHCVMPAYKAKRTDRATEKWLMKHPDRAMLCKGTPMAERVLAAVKQVTYDTTENRFVSLS